ncbi:MAG: DUF421 domain-containing protein [Clostridia bacterium]|jgi:uncharacterized membrane protein YcaP (DUF421 family)
MTYVIRTIVLYIIVIAVMRLMGKRQIGELQPYELAVAIMISELATVPMQETGMPMVNGIIPILTILLMQLTFSFLSLKSIKLRAIISGKPVIIIEKGRIVEDNMKKELYTVNELAEQLRIKNIANISDVEYAILETNGQLSVIPKVQNRAVTCGDLNIPGKYESYPYYLVIDGKVLPENFSKAGVKEKDFLNYIHSKKIDSVKDILYANIDDNKKIFIQLKLEKGGKIVE